MRRSLFVLLVAAGCVSMMFGVAMAFVSPWLSDDNMCMIRSFGTIAPYGAESEADEDISTMYVDPIGCLSIFAGAGLLSVAFLGRQRKTN